MAAKVHSQPLNMTTSERSSKHMLETGSSVSYKSRWPSVCASLVSLFALIVSIATLTLVALFYYQFQNLNLIDIHTSKRATYTPLPWMTPFDLDKYDTFLFDVDGTIKNADGYIPGSRELMMQLRKKNKTVMIVSNSDWTTPEERAKSLDLEPSNVVIPLAVLKYLEASHLPGKRILALAPPPVTHWLTEIGAILLNNHWNHTQGHPSSVDGLLATLAEKPDIVIIDSWNDYSMEAVDRIANILVNPEVKFYILSTDAAWRGEKNLIFSDGGSFYEAIKMVTRRNATGFGKPSYNLNRYMRENFELTKAIMFGDNLNTDFLTANELGIDSCLMVGTGVHNEIDWRQYYDGGDLSRRPSYKGSFVQLAQMVV